MLELLQCQVTERKKAAALKSAKWYVFISIYYSNNFIYFTL